MGILYDATKCVGCKACMAACKRVNASSGGLCFEHARFDQDGLWDAHEGADLQADAPGTDRIGDSQ